MRHQPVVKRLQRNCTGLAFAGVMKLTILHALMVPVPWLDLACHLGGFWAICDLGFGGTDGYNG